MWGFSSHPSPQHPSGEGTSHPPWSFPRKGLWFQFCIPKVNTDPCCQGRRPSTTPHRALGGFPSHRGLCHQPAEPRVPNATHDLTRPVLRLRPPEMDNDQGCWMKETSRDKVQNLLPPKPAREVLGTLPFASIPVLSHCTCSSLRCQAGGHRARL